MSNYPQSLFLFPWSLARGQPEILFLSLPFLPFALAVYLPSLCRQEASLVPLDALSVGYAVHHAG